MAGKRTAAEVAPEPLEDIDACQSSSGSTDENHKQQSHHGALSRGENGRTATEVADAVQLAMNSLFAFEAARNLETDADDGQLAGRRQKRKMSPRAARGRLAKEIFYNQRFITLKAAEPGQQALSKLALSQQNAVEHRFAQAILEATDALIIFRSLGWKALAVTALLHLADYCWYGQPKARLGHLEAALELQLERYSKDHREVLLLMETIATEYSAGGNLSEALRLRTECLHFRNEELQTIAKSLGQEHPEVVAATARVGRLLVLVEDYAKGLDYLERALEMFTRLKQASGSPHTHHPDLAATLLSLGEAHTHFGHYRSALLMFWGVLKCEPPNGQGAMEKLATLATTAAPSVYRNLGNVHLALGNLGKATELYHQALQLTLSAVGDAGHPNVGTAFIDLGKTYGVLGDHSKSMDCFSKASNILSHYDGRVAAVMTAKGNAYVALGQHVEAVEQFRKAMGVKQKLYRSKKHSEVLKSALDIAMVKQVVGDLEGALKDCVVIEDAQVATLGPHHVDLAKTRHIMGVILSSQGQYQAALRRYQAAFDILDKEHMRDHPELGTLLLNTAMAHQCLDEPQLAMPLVSRALRIFREAFGEQHDQVVQTLIIQGKMLYQRHELERALQSFLQAKSLVDQKGAVQDVQLYATLGVHIAQCEYDRGNLKRALEANDKAAQFLKQAGSNDTGTFVLLTSLLRKLGTVLNRLGRHEEALSHLNECRRLETTRLSSSTRDSDHHADQGETSGAEGAVPPLLAISFAATLETISNVIKDSQDAARKATAPMPLENALESVEQAVRLRLDAQDAGGNTDIHLAAALALRGNILQRMGRVPEARDGFNQALQLVGDDDGRGDPVRSVVLARTLELTGVFFQSTGDWEKAYQFLQLALDTKTSHLTPYHPELTDTLRPMAEVARGLGKLDESLELLERLLVVQKQTFGEMHPDVAATLNDLGLSYHALKHFEQALAFHAEALKIRKETMGDVHQLVADSMFNQALALGELGRMRDSVLCHAAAHSTLSAALGPSHEKTKFVHTVMLRVMAQKQPAEASN